MVLGARALRAAALLHFLCLLWATFALSQNIGLPKSVRKAQDTTYGGHWKHLTFLNQVLQNILYILCTTIDTVALCLPSEEKTVSRALVPIRDFIFSAFVFPIGLFVAVAFWGLYAYDRELVYPKELDDINPSWLNHSMHTTILPLLFIELYICPHKYPSRIKGIFGLAFFAVTYLVWILWVHYKSGIWAYPVLGVLSPGGMVIFFFVTFVIMVTFYFLGEQLTNWLWTRRKKKYA
ncbi:androgen-induced gene 1 protein-like [Anolis sagrei]|uniref:androgen-induced gene 1 protein-like n=1 Tax=Anolis sagrei TaxID=38937 RepID=UPI00351F83EA